MPSRPPVHRAPRTPPPDARATAAERGYGSRWQRARLTFLNDHPLCVRCEAKGLVTEATVVDHVTPHKGDQGLFWDEANWQSLCETCHNQKTANEDGAFGRDVKR